VLQEACRRFGVAVMFRALQEPAAIAAKIMEPTIRFERTTCSLRDPEDPEE
jgi:hypothetical protein